MQLKKITAIAIAAALSATSYAADTFDMGKVQVVGKDAQSTKIDISQHMLSFTPEDKMNEMPALAPIEGVQDYRPMTEKKPINTFNKRSDGEVSVAAGIGNNNGGEFILHGKGNHEGYNGNAMFKTESRKGYKTDTNTKYIGATGNISTTTEVGAIFTVDGEISKDDFGIRGTRTNPTPKASAETAVKRISFSGSTTQEDGAYLKGELTVDHLDRDVRSGIAGFLKNQEIFSLGFSGTYLRKSENKFRNRATFELKKEDLDISSERSMDFTKSSVGFGTDYEISQKSNACFGFKLMKSMQRSSTSPYLTINHKLSEPWLFTFSYDEDLKNDSFEKIFMARHYVESNAKKIVASKIKTAKGTFKFKNINGDTFAVDLFTQIEYDAIEYSDQFDPGSNLTGSVYDFMEAKRTGVILKSNFKVENHFVFDIDYTFQNPRNENANRRISYEPRRLMNVNANYQKNKLDINFSRRVEYDRRARIYIGALPTIQSASDYSRSDIAFKYKANETYTAYIKIRDLYDEAKKLRFDVEEEGRVFIGGLEAHF